MTTIRSSAGIAREIAQTDLFVMGGGGIFQDYGPFHIASLYDPQANDIANYAKPFYMARQFGVPTAIIGQGIGPLRKSEGRLIVRDIFSLADHVSVRDEASVDLLREMGVSRELIVAPDPVWESSRWLPTTRDELDAPNRRLRGPVPGAISRRRVHLGSGHATLLVCEAGQSVDSPWPTRPG